MKNPACLLLLFLLFAGISASAQTKRIAHKSHSGSDITFTNAGPDEFGDPGPMTRLDSVFRINDSTVVTVSAMIWPPGPNQRDTMVRHPYFNDPKIGVDSLRKIYPKVVFVGFDNKQNPGDKPKKVKRNSASPVFPGAAEPGSGNTLLILLVSSLAVAIVFFTWKKQIQNLVPVKNKINRKK
ncbi:MAG: hypothetical protein FD123_4254 [Bacteroidetes bacterium]|nr:MAG: hypothetical protein FD123_4254 [Bacteroidota bacterium]